MLELNGYEKGGLAGFMYGNLVRYRAIPALYVLANRGRPEDKWDTTLEKALAGLKSILRILKYRSMSDEDILEMVDKHKNWIKYTFHDMHYYHTKLVEPGFVESPEAECRRMRYYLPAMAEIVNSPFIDWRMQTFDTGVEHPTILDVGCGYAPYLELMHRDNRGDIHYIAVDTRAEAMVYLEDPAYLPVDTMVYKYGCDINILLSKMPKPFKAVVDTANCVFFGNSLHCFEESQKLLAKVAKLPKVSKIMVLEFAPQSALNFMFDFHMYMHAGTGAVESMPLWGTIGTEWHYETSYPTTQHMMHTYTRKL